MFNLQGDAGQIRRAKQRGGDNFNGWIALEEATCPRFHTDEKPFQLALVLLG